MSCNCNNECNNIEETTCNCPVKDLSTDCVMYTGDGLNCSNIPQNTPLSKLIKQLDDFICEVRDNIMEYIVQVTTLINIGTGAEIFKQINGLGNKEFRTIISDDLALLDIIEEEDTINIKPGTPSLNFDETLDELTFRVTTALGTSEFSSINLGKYNYDTFVQNVTFDNLTQILTIIRNNSEPNIDVNLNDLNNHLESVSFNTNSNNIEFTLTDSTILTLNTNTFLTNLTLPIASEAEQGIIEIATQAEVDAGTDTEKAITPSTLNSNITTIISNPANLPNATEIQRGVAEIATQAEVDAGTDDEKIVTPLKLNSVINTAVTNYLNSININPIQNTGTISPIDPGGGTVGSLYTVSGDITQAELEDISGASARILVTMANPMTNTSYVVKTFHESLGTINTDDNLLVTSFKPVSTTQFRISISDPIGGVQLIRLHLDIEQR